MRWKDFLYFQRNSKIAVILLLILILLTLILNILLGFRNSSNVILMQNDSLVREFEEFRQSLTERESPATIDAPDDSKERKEVAPQSPGISSFSEGTASHSAEKQSQPYAPRSRGVSSSRTAYPSIGKLSEGETILLNESDTTDWKKVPGIGSVYAARIVNYRDLLGGFKEVDQLLEVYGIDQELFSRIAVYIEPDTNLRKLRVNDAEFRELLRHPYLSYKQVQAIMSIRRRKGDIGSIRELSMLDEFTTEDILRLDPYLAF